MPAVLAWADRIPITASLQGNDMVVWLGRYVGDSLDWIVIEPVERRQPRLVLTAESANALAHGLIDQLCLPRQTVCADE